MRPTNPWALILAVSNQVLSVKHVPEWFPGAGFQKKARIWRKFGEEAYTAPFEAVKQALVSSFSRPAHYLADTF